jgi:hypothetical protein
MRYPVSERVIAHVAVAVDEHASAGQVREHGAGITTSTEVTYLLAVRCPVHRSDAW